MRILLIVALMLSLVLTSASADERFESVAATSGHTFTINVPGRDLPRMVSVTLENLAQGAVVFPKVVANNRGDWSDLDTLLSDMLEPGMTEREKAMAIFMFITDNRFHFHPAYPGAEIHDPVRFFNGYGWGYCDDCAYNSCYLARAAGLKGRAWGLSGHVVPEIWFDGKWCMLDPDHEIFYFMRDNKTVAGVEDVQQDPDLCTRVLDFSSPSKNAGEGVKKIYARKDKHRVSEGSKKWWYPKGEPHVMSIVLRPGEKMIRRWDNEGKFVSAYAAHSKDARWKDAKSAPPVFANGRIVYEPALTPAAIRKWSSGYSNIRAGKSPKLTCADSAKPGWVTYKVESPYPIAGSCVEGSFTRTDADSLSIYVSSDNQKWGQPLWTAAKTLTFDTSVDLSATVNTHTGNAATHEYYVKVEMIGAGARIHSLRIITLIQVAPRSLPVLTTGKNSITYTDTSNSRKVRIEFVYTPGAMKLPRIVSVFPEAEAKNVPVAVSLAVKVDRDIGSNRWFVDSGAILFSESEFVPCKLTYDRASHTVRIVPVRQLQKGMEYTAIVHRRVFWSSEQRGIVRQPLGHVKWSFHTRY